MSLPRCVSPALTQELNLALKALYTSRLPQAATRLQSLLVRVEGELGAQHAVTVQLTKKLMFGIKNYGSREEAVAFLHERTSRCPETPFETFLLTQSLGETKDATDFLRLLSERHPVKLLITQILIAHWYVSRQKPPLLGLNVERSIEMGLHRMETLEITQEEDAWYLAYAYTEMAFLLRLKNQPVQAVGYLRKALKVMAVRSSVDVEGIVVLYTYLLKYQRAKSPSAIPADTRAMISWIDRLVRDHDTAWIYDFKTLKQAFTYLAKGKDAGWDRLRELGLVLLHTVVQRHDLPPYSLDGGPVTLILTRVRHDPRYAILKQIPEFFCMFVQLLAHLSKRATVLASPLVRELIYDGVALPEATRTEQTAKSTVFYVLARQCAFLRMSFFQEVCSREHLRLHRVVYGEVHYRLMAPQKALARLLMARRQRPEAKRWMQKALQQYAGFLDTWYLTRTGQEMIEFLTQLKPKPSCI